MRKKIPTNPVATPATLLEPTLSVQDVLDRYGLKNRISIWRGVRDGTLPAPFKPGRNMRWLQSQIVDSEQNLVKQAQIVTRRARDRRRKKLSRAKVRA